jgi:xanthine dehydrogenase small subunit
LKQREKERVKALKKFFLAYKSLDKQPDEIITSFLIPKQNSSNNRYFNFEKVSKRTNLDIASVNSAIFVEVTKEGKIENILISAGGIAPIPKFLEKTSLFLQHKKIDSQVISLAIEIASREISPISDVRGSKEYKTSLLGKLILAHFITLFPQYVNFEEVYA